MARICQYGNCDKDVVVGNGNGVSVNYHGQDKPVFCCGTHAGLWLLNRDGHRNFVREFEQADRKDARP